MTIALRGLCLQILEGKSEPAVLKREFARQFEGGVGSSSQLKQAYLAFAAHLLHLEPLPLFPEQFPNGAALLDPLGQEESLRIPEPTQLAELGTMWMVLGTCLKNELLQRAGLKVATWHVHLLDREGRPHLSLWSPGSTFSKAAFTEWSYALFQAAYGLTSHAGFQKLASLFQEGTSHTMTLLLAQMKGFTQLSPPRCLAEEVTVGILKFASSEMSLMAHLSGSNSGLFSVHKKEVALLNCGPQVGPCDALHAFGISRICGRGRSFQDILWEKTAHHCHLKGWTRVAGAPLWMHLDTTAQAGQITCEIAFQEGKCVDGLSLLFFLKGSQLIVGGKRQFEPGSLEQHDGEATTLELRSGEEKMVLDPETTGSMRVIPLAGGSHFWGADFLIAFSQANNFLINIK